MAEVLSQSQIDALLNAVRSGEKDLDKSTESTQEKKWRKYDFSSPQKFTKDRIKMLNAPTARLRWRALKSSGITSFPTP